MITLSEAPTSTGGIKGLLSTSSDNNGKNFPPAAAGTRSVVNGTITTNYFPGFSDGTLIGSLDTGTGIWTAPADGWYSFTTLFSLSADISPFNNLTSVDNPNGFIGNGAPPSSSYAIVGTPQTLDFPNYFGSFSVGVITPGGGTVMCSNTQEVTYNTSHIIISATYTARYLTSGFQLCVKWLNKCTNTIKGQAGNSTHFTAIHLK
jgi:hypothetical protein